MSVTIRLSRFGGKKKPFYRVVAADHERARDGRCLEVLGTYDPKAEKGAQLKKDRIQFWVARGAQVSDRVSKLLKQTVA